MRPLSDTALLDLWERGDHRTSVDRALLLFAAARPGQTIDTLLDLPLPQRDHAILELRRAHFGSRFAGTVACPHCREHVEFDIDMAHQEPPHADPDSSVLTLAGGQRFRLPTTRDLLAASQAADADRGTQVLLERCHLPASEEASAMAPCTLDEVDAGLARLAGIADVNLDFVCAACQRPWRTTLDICTFFWEELRNRVHQVLDDVHRLAAAYGWAEHDILAMSPVRRAAYLQRCAS